MRSNRRLAWLCAFGFGVVACGGASGDPNLFAGGDGSVGDDASHDDSAGGGDGSSADGGGGEAGGGGDGSVADVAGFDPSTVQGLALWLDAARAIMLNNAHVAKWSDQTANHNDATQSNAVLQPVVGASWSRGLPAVHFDKGASAQTQGNELVIADSASLQWGTGDFYVVVVGSFDNTLADGPELGVGLLYSKTAGGAAFTGPALFANIPGGANNGNGAAAGLTFTTGFAPGNIAKSTTARNDNTPHAFEMQRVGAQMDLRVDGVSVATSSSTGVDVSSAGALVRIGGDADGRAVRLDGFIGEVLAVKGALGASDRSALEAYVKTKYGL